ncbi:MAG: outer membrane protein assembly factor BamD, partial [Calditrichaeota bacterium]|nr:outer membrane protein assembly factor BamD [Calditrichota bacterium]
MLKRLIPFLWLAVLLWPVFSQEQAEQRLFDAGVAAYKSGNYESAQQSFLELLQKYPNGALITGIRLMLAKSYYKLSNY